MSVEFKRQVVIDNIMTLIQSRGLKVGEVEKKLGVSVGYLSRLSKKENDSALSAEFIWNAAQYFGVSVDCLIRSHIDEEDRLIDYMRNFINKIIKHTDEGTLEWSAIPVEEINHILMGETRMAFPVIYVQNAGFSQRMPHASDDPIRIDNALSCWGNNKVMSCIHGGAIVNPQGTVYHTRMSLISQPYKELYLACYCTDTESGSEEFYELMLLDRQEWDHFWQSQNSEEHRQVIGKSEIPRFVEGVCNTYQTAWEPIKVEMQALYKTVSSHDKDLVISDSVKNFIDAFVNFEDTLPF